MDHWYMSRKIFIIVLSVLTVSFTTPFSLAESVASPIGTVVTTSGVTIGNSMVPTGTAVFSGDWIASREPALIDFNSGSRIEMTKAAATVARQENAIIIQASQGLFRFNFKKGEEAQITAGKYSFTALNKSAHVGEMGLNHNGQVVLNVTEGAFTALNTTTGEETEVNPDSPLVASDPSGQGSIAKNGMTLEDSSKSFQLNELRGKCVVANGEAYPITGNTSSTIAVKGSWKSSGGNYGYKVVDCTREALTNAGAANEAAESAAAASKGAASAAGISAGVKAAIVAGVGGAVGIGLGIHQASKSSSSR